ncbi:MAG: hypothetical protein SVV80_10280, partial [Planctomycetota bacterium]|nr:hypothetical protein [Planctomycetota bacterium]
IAIQARRAGQKLAVPARARCVRQSIQSPNGATEITPTAKPSVAPLGLLLQLLLCPGAYAFVITHISCFSRYLFVPQGRDDNSPAIHCWERDYRCELSPAGTIDLFVTRIISIVPTGLHTLNGLGSQR